MLEPIVASLRKNRRPMKKDAITAAVAADLVAEQFPQWADLPVVPVALNGWDNTTFRLGDSLSVRLPSHDRYVPQVEKEQHWLPALAPLLPLPIPEPVALGQRSDIFPRPWSIYRWIEGHPALAGEVTDFGTFANDLARFLAALYSIDARQGPGPGDHSFFRGGPLDPYDAQTRESIAVVADEIDPDLATGAWEAALASSWERPAVWVHGDVAPSNLLAMDGRLQRGHRLRLRCGGRSGLRPGDGMDFLLRREQHLFPTQPCPR